MLTPLESVWHIRLLIANDDEKEVFKAFGAGMPILSFSAEIHADGTVCKSQYGLLNGKYGIKHADDLYQGMVDKWLAKLYVKNHP